MVTVLAAVTGFAVALVLVLGWMVFTLRREVGQLAAQLSRSQSSPEPPRVASAPSEPPVQSPEPTPTPSVRTVVSLDARDEEDALDPAPIEEAQPARASQEVPIITALVDPVDEIDLTTRRVASVTLARPLIKIAAFSFGVRRALDDESRMRVRLAMRRELKRQRKMRRRRRAGRAPSQGWVP